MNYRNDNYWYPTVDDIKRVHSQVLEKNPDKYPGEMVSPESKLPSVIRTARNTPGIYKKAAVLMKKIASEHVFEDGNTTTAILIAKKFLDKNNKKFKPKDQKLTGKMADNHGLFSMEEISYYFKTGDIDETKL